MKKMRGAFLSATGFALAGLMLSVTPGRAQPLSPAPDAQESQNLSDQQQQFGQGNCSNSQFDSDAQQGETALPSASEGQGCIAGEDNQQALNDQDRNPSLDEQNQFANGSEQNQDLDQQQQASNSDLDQEQGALAQDREQYSATRGLSEFPSASDRDQYSSQSDLDEQQALADRDENGVNGDSDVDEQHEVANEAEIHGSAGVSGDQQFAANPDAYGHDQDTDQHQAVVGEAQTYGHDQDVGAQGQSLEQQEDLNAGREAGGGTLLLFGQIRDPGRVLANAEVQDNSGQIVGHVSAIQHEGGQDQALIMLRDMKMVALPTEHFRFDPSRNLLIADLSAEQIEASAG